MNGAIGAIVGVVSGLAAMSFADAAVIPGTNSSAMFEPTIESENTVQDVGWRQHYRQRHCYFRPGYRYCPPNYSIWHRHHPYFYRPGFYRPQYDY